MSKAEVTLLKETNSLLVKERDQLREQLAKAEADKAEAIEIAIENIDRLCQRCAERFLKNQYCKEGCIICTIDKNAIERLTGKKWEEHRDEAG